MRRLEFWIGARLMQLGLRLMHKTSTLTVKMDGKRVYGPDTEWVGRVARPAYPERGE